MQLVQPGRLLTLAPLVQRGRLLTLAPLVQRGTFSGIPEPKAPLWIRARSCEG